MGLGMFYHAGLLPPQPTGNFDLTKPVLETSTVSGSRNQMIAAIRKLTDARLITGARPNASARGAVMSGAVMLMTRPQL